MTRDDLQRDVGETEPFLECDKVKSKAKVGERCIEQFSKKEEVRMLWQFLPLFIIVQYN